MYIFRTRSYKPLFRCRKLAITISVENYYCCSHTRILFSGSFEFYLSNDL